jgi:hypothetical protein
LYADKIVYTNWMNLIDNKYNLSNEQPS